MLRALSVNAPVGQLLRRYQRMTLIVFLVIFAGIALKLENVFKFQCIPVIHFMPQLSWNVYLES